MDGFRFSDIGAEDEARTLAEAERVRQDFIRVAALPERAETLFVGMLLVMTTALFHLSPWMRWSERVEII